MNTKTRLKQAKRIVVKVGSALLLDEESNLNRVWLQSLIEDVQQCRANNQEVILVCSGSVALGRKHLTKPGASSLPEKQAAAAIGQVALAHAYQDALAQAGLVGAQLLLTLDDSEDRRRYLNASNTLATLLEYGFVPIINENDSVATAELRVGDNDRLAARVAQMAHADVVILFSDVAGLYTANPFLQDSAELIPEVDQITPAIEKIAGPSHNNIGSGGMITKIQAAKIATRSGCHLLLTQGKPMNPISRLYQNPDCTWFLAHETPQSARKNWLAHKLEPKGKLWLDQGACQAIRKGNSLLAAGVTKLVGEFYKGDAVELCNEEGETLGIGLSDYNANDIQRCLGRHSKDIEEILGFSNGKAIIHRDNMALTESSNSQEEL